MARSVEAGRRSEEKRADANVDADADANADVDAEQKMARVFCLALDSGYDDDGVSDDDQYCR